MIVRSFATATATALAVATGSALAQTAPPAKPAPQRATVVKDAATGRLRAPTAEEAAELAATQPPSSARSARRAAPAEVQHPNGAVSMEVDDSLMMYSVARRNPDGSVAVQCVTGDKAARSILRKSTPQPVVSKAAKGGALELQ